MGFDNIIEGKGIGIAITGLLIVFVALIVISVFIALLPRVLGILEKFLPPEAPAHAPAGQRTNEEELVAAIGFAMHQRSRRKPPS